MKTMVVGTSSSIGKMFLNDVSNAVSKRTSLSVPEKPRKSSSKKNTVDDGRPRRPLTSYNIFFQIERKKIMEEQKSSSSSASRKESSDPRRDGRHANVGFANLARMVAARWKLLDAKTKRYLEEQARLDKERYHREMDEWSMKVVPYPEMPFYGVFPSVPDSIAVHNQSMDQSKIMMLCSTPGLQEGKSNVSVEPSFDMMSNVMKAHEGAVNIVTPEDAPKTPISIVMTNVQDFAQKLPAPPLFIAPKEGANLFCAPCELPEFLPAMNQTDCFNSNSPVVHVTDNEMNERISCFAYHKMNNLSAQNSARNGYDNSFDVHGYNYNGLEAKYKNEIEDVVRGLYSKRRSQFMTHQ